MSYRFSPEQLRSARTEKGWSRSELGWTVRTREENIRRWETGKAEPRIGTLAAIAVALGQTIEFFLVESGDDDEEEAAA